MSTKIAKSREITDAHISFISLVDKAANKHSFAIVKADDGKANFTTFGRIVKVDPESHYVTGVVYEPMAEDTQGDHMTAEEVQKAAYWYAKHRGDVDIQHSFEKLDGATEVESWVTKNDETIGDQQIKKGTWMATVEITDPDIFDKVQKGEITGFSMGGTGKYIESDDSDDDPAVEKAEKESVLAKLKKWLSGDTVEKGEVADRFNAGFVSRNLWEAWYALSDVLTDKYDPDTQIWGNEKDMAKVAEALQDFNDITTKLFSNQDSLPTIFKSADGEEPPIVKAGKAMSRKNRDQLKSITDSLSDFLKSFDDGDGDGDVPSGESEEIEVTKEEMQEVVKSAVQEAIKATGAAPETVKKEDQSTQAQEPETITKADVQAMIDEAIQKAMAADPKDPKKKSGQCAKDEDGEVQKADADKPVAEQIQDAIAKAMAPYLRQEGLPTNLNGADGEEVAKSQEEQCFLHGII